MSEADSGEPTAGSSLEEDGENSRSGDELRSESAFEDSDPEVLPLS